LGDTVSPRDGFTAIVQFSLNNFSNAKPFKTESNIESCESGFDCIFIRVGSSSQTSRPQKIMRALLNNIPARQDGRGYSIEQPTKEDVDDSSVLKQSPVISSSDSRSSISSSDSSRSSISSSDSSVGLHETNEPNTLQSGKGIKWPLCGIKEPGNNDCLTGRGGGTNYHPGNIKYRYMVEDNKAAYKAATRSSKSTMSMKIVQDWRSLEPPGRFLKFNEQTGLWDDVGDEEARGKVSQALREKRASKLVPESSMHVGRLERTVTQANTGETAAPPTEPDNHHQLQSSITTMHAVMGKTAAPLTDPSNNAIPNNNAITHTSILETATLTESKPPIATQPTAQEILTNCLFAISMSNDDFSLLSGTVDDEFQTIKKAYFQTIIQLHPDRNPNGDHAARRYTRAAFEVLRSVFHKIRAQRSSFICLFAATDRDLGFINDLYVQYTSVWYASFPSYEHFVMAAGEERPSIRVELSIGGCQCSKCSGAISIGEIVVGILSGKEYGHWQHMRCWSVPLELLSGLTQPQDLTATLRDMLSMDEVFITGLTRLDYASQLELVRYLMKRKKWVIARTRQNVGGKLSNQPQIVGSDSSRGESCNREGIAVSLLGDQKEDLEWKMDQMDPANVTQIPRGLARPLKKRAIVADSLDLEKRSNQHILAGSAASVAEQLFHAGTAPAGSRLLVAQQPE